MLASGITAAPDLDIPQTLQRVFLWLTIGLAGGVTLAAGLVSIRHKSGVPLLMVTGGLAAILMEPVVTFLGHAVHPAGGQIMLFEAVGRAIPWHIALGYMGGFGIFYLIFYAKYESGSLTARSVWKITLITALCYYLGEAYPVEHGLWAYYEPQPLWFWKGTAPPTWSILNATCMLTSTALMFAALPRLKGAGLLLLVPLAVSGAYMGHMGAGFPMYLAMNAAVPVWFLQLSGAAAIAMALVIVWMCSHLLAQPRSSVETILQKKPA